MKDSKKDLKLPAAASVFFCIVFFGCSLDVGGTFDAAGDESPVDGEDADRVEFFPDADDGGAPEDAQEQVDLPEESECLSSAQCTDGNPCNGEETCDPGTSTCVGGEAPGEGTVCSSDGDRRICLAGACVASECGDGFVDTGAGESCEPPGEGSCGSDCRFPCNLEEGCPDDGNPCNGEEFCDTAAGICSSRNPPATGSECATDPRRICIASTCQASRCGDAYTDPLAGEECDDGNDTPADGCEPVTCLFSCHLDADCDDGHGCTQDTCDPGMHVCIHGIQPAATLCRAAADVCDAPESCDGTGRDCPADGFRPGSQVCRSAAGACDVAETCSGVSASCPADAFAPSSTLCRASVVQCDRNEYCPGSSAACPPDGLEPEGSPCNDGDPCTYPDTCSLGGICQGPASNLTDVLSVAPGSEHTCALMLGGGVKCWGRDDKGQLGNGAGGDSSRPVDVSGLTSGVQAICSGEKHSCALTVAGGVKCWGLNDKGQLGDGTATDRQTPVDVTGLASAVSAIACGSKHTCALLGTGGVRCWGLNDKGQLGDGTTTDRLTPVSVSGLSSGVGDISCGEKHTCAVLTSNALRCWGWNDRGQVGDGSTTDRSSPANVSGLSSGVADVSCGGKHTCALLDTGGLKCWGLNDKGQLGDGTTTDRSSPVDVATLSSGVLTAGGGASHTCAVLQTTAIMCWGNNNRGQLGDGTTTDRTRPVNVVCP